MAYLGRFLGPTRASFYVLSSSNTSLYHSRNSVIGKHGQIKAWMKGHGHEASKFHSKSNMQGKCMHKLSSSGRKIGLGGFLGLSCLAGLMKPTPVAYAMNGDNILMEEGQADVWDASGCFQDDPDTFWGWARKWWLPILLVVTVLTGWQHPFSLAIKISLFLFGTRPSPSSLHLFIEQLRCQYLRQHPELYNLKFLYVKKVEVEDYKLLCLAKVELRDKKISLIGIMGSWWIFESSSYPRSTSIFGL